MSFNDIKSEADCSEEASISPSNVSSSLLGGDNLDAAEAAVAKLGSIMDDHANGKSTHVKYFIMMTFASIASLTQLHYSLFHINSN